MILSVRGRHISNPGASGRALMASLTHPRPGPGRGLDSVVGRDWWRYAPSLHRQTRGGAGRPQDSLGRGRPGPRGADQLEFRLAGSGEHVSASGGTQRETGSGLTATSRASRCVKDSALMDGSSPWIWPRSPTRGCPTTRPRRCRAAL